MKNWEPVNRFDCVCEETELPTKTSQLTNDSGFLTGVPAEYITDTELQAKGYALKSEIPTVESISNSEIDSLFTA